MIAGIADTHAVIWYLTPDPRLSKIAKSFIDSAAQDRNQIGVSSITLVEIVYLIEKGRIPVESFTRLTTALQVAYSTFVEIPIDLQIARSLSRVDGSQIPDMPDRIIAATALHVNAPVISRDNRIRLATLNTIW